MKKLILTLLLASLFFGINAQEKTPTNKFVLGGSMSFLTQKNTVPLSILDFNFGIGSIFSNSFNDTKNTTFRFNPYFGKELNPNWILGLELNYAHQNYKAKDTPVVTQPPNVQTRDFNQKSNQIGIGIFGRYTINPQNNFNFFLEPSINYHFFGEESTFDDDLFQEETAGFIEVGAGVGVLYQVNDLLRITLRSGGLRYINGNWEIKDSDISKDFSSFSGNLSLSNLSFGVEFRL